MDDIFEAQDQQNERIPDINPRTGKPKRTAADWVRDMRMSADVNRTTTGVNTDRVTSALLLATSKRLLGISRREQEPDPKDSLEFQRFYGPAEYFAEHVLRDGNKLGRNLLWKATNRGNLDFMASGALDKHVSDVFYNSKLAQMVDASSPLETVDASYKTTRIGEGGVSDISSAPDEMRLIQPSYFGYIDPARTPERKRVGLDMYITKHAQKGSDGKLYQKFINAHTGKEELVDSVTASKSIVASPEMMDAKTKSVFALGGPTGVRIVPKKDVDYYLPRADEAYSMTSNMVVMPSAVKEMRLLMGCLHPMTSIFTIGRHNEINIGYAKNISADKQSIPGMAENGASLCYAMRNTIAKVPPARKHFRKIVLRSGRVLITSIDHKWPVLRDGERVLVRADELKQGDTVFRSVFCNIPNRRTFLRGKLVNNDVATFLGVLCRGVRFDKGDVLRMAYQPEQEASLKRATERLELEGVHFYTKENEKRLRIKDVDFAHWVYENIGIAEKTLVVPSVILSGHVDVAAAFLDGYTKDPTQVGVDSNEDLWVLNIPNTLMRDALSFLFMRTGTDTLYRDAVRSDGISLALKIRPISLGYEEMVLDTVKHVLAVKDVPIMIDIDINDNLYAVGNGIVTHNSKYPLQAVSIESRQAPLVRGLDEASGKDMPSLTGKYLGARYTDRPGTVAAVRKDRIDMVYDDGTKGSIAMYQNFPTNSKGYLTNTPVVKAGQHLDKGALVASSNYTNDKGEAALGTNLRSAWMSWHGGTYEDAATISESAAKKLASTTMYKTAIDLDKTVSLGKHNYVTWKPSEYTKEQMENLDDDGIIKPGSVVHRGDPMILAVQTTEPSPGTLGKRILTDVSETWDHEHEGVVTDVVRTRKGVKVFATVTAPVEVGDKISGSFGNKQIVSAIIPDEQMPVDENGDPIEVITSPLGLISRCYDSQTEFLTKRGWVLGKDVADTDFLYCYDKKSGAWSWGKQTAPMYKARYIGKVYGVQTDEIDFLVTKGHKVWCKKEGQEAFEEVKVDTIVDTKVTLPSVGLKRTIEVPASDFELPEECVKVNDAGFTCEASAWAELLGWYIAAGTVGPRPGEDGYITAFKPLDRNKQDYSTSAPPVKIYNKGIGCYMTSLGDKQTMRIPHWIFEQPVAVIKRFLGCLFPALREGESGWCHYTALNPDMADQLQVLCCMAGYTSVKTGTVDLKVKQTAHVEASEWYSKNYTGMTYCPTVETGYILTRRNGRVICLGNTNQSQIYEALLGKVAEKTGKPEIVPAFAKEDLYDYVANKLKQNHLRADEELTDPNTGRKIPNVLVGRSYMYKLKHLAESKLSARGTDEYDSEGVPAGEGEDKSKRFGSLETTALVGHDAFDVIQDAKLIRGQNNSKFWRDIRTGGIPTIPGEPLVHKKFFSHLIGSGINVRRTQKGMSVFALSNDDVNQLAGPRELKSRDTYETKTFRPIDGGLFGQDVFGVNGDKWGYIQLDDPVPNPVMEEPIARLLRIPEKSLIAATTGTQEVDGMKSGKDIKDRLAKIDLKLEAAKALNEFKEAPLSKKDAALKRYVAIERMNRLGVSPDQYMLDRIPVLPPIYRPVTTHNGLTMVADSNYLYAQMLDARDDLREAANLPAEYQQRAKERLYKDWKELTGLYEPEDVKLRSKHVQGLLKWALGDSPKFSAVQRKVIGSTVDTVGRGVIVPDSRLTLNQVGIPKRMAFGIMAPFVERMLVQRGYSPIDAMKQVKEQTPQATELLQEVMKTHPVLMNRAPSLHKLNVMVFDPVLVAGNAVHVNPSIVVPYAADFDGDTVNLHVPVSDNARREARNRMYPDRNLVGMRNRKVLYKPEREYQQGLYIATRMKQGENVRPRIFRTLEEARDARRRGIIDIDDPIVIEDTNDKQRA